MTAAPTRPLNALEELLQRAAAGDTTAQSEFATTLLDSDLWVAGAVEGAARAVGDGSAEVTPGARLRLFPVRGEDGRSFLPAFTSVERFRQAISETTPYLGLPGRVVLEARPADVPVHINPGVWYGKEMLPGEIADLLSGRGPGDPRKEVVPAGTEVMLGLPAHFPQELAEALAALFRSSGGVAEARLGWMHMPSSVTPPHPLVGVRPVAGVSYVEALAGVDAVVKAHYEGPVDFVPLDDDGMGDWLLANTEPFFKMLG